MPDTGEFPSGGSISFLSRILLAVVPEKILFKPESLRGDFEKGGKVLPLMLRMALEERAGVKTLTA